MAGDEGYWLPVDAEKDIETNWISNSHMTTTLRAIRAKHVMVVADSCYSGKLTCGVNIKNRTTSYLARIVRKRSRTVLSSGGLEPVLNSGGKENHSVFATAFIEALTENEDIVDATHIFTKIRRTAMLNSIRCRNMPISASRAMTVEISYFSRCNPMISLIPQPGR